MTNATTTLRPKGAPTGDPSEHRFRFESDSEAAVFARQALRELDSGMPAHVLSDAMLCVTELVTNSVQWAEVADRESVEMAVKMSDDNVRVEVGDAGRGFARRRFARRALREHGYGLYIVELLSDRWGVEQNGHTWVWFEIDLRRAGANL
jgi:anti-sigma regulatory factor (Ser/Thr protein kinase)